MSLDVELVRRDAEPWGFRLIGGRDYNMPLTVVKVQPSSPAEAAGLRDGDTLVSIAGVPAGDMTHGDAHAAITGCAGAGPLAVQITRGLYDPVLDEQEIIFEPIEPEDFGQSSSDPTEVFTPIPLLPTLSPYPLDEIPESRSHTASPFVLPTKPYRPFSTEPILEVPPLEEPIILNPDYHDEFGRTDEGEFLPKSKFKLPISEQYDPNFGKEKKVKDKMFKEDKMYAEKFTREEEQVMKEMKQEEQFMQRMKQDIDLEKMESSAFSSVIEREKVESVTVKVAEQSKEQKSSKMLTEEEIVKKTALSVVDESIEKAVTVAEDIKKEIDVELKSSESSSIKIESKDVKKLIENIDKKSEDKKSQKKESKVSKLYDESISLRDEQKKLSEKQEVEEIIVSGTVKSLSDKYNKEAQIATVEVSDDRKKQTAKHIETQSSANETMKDSTSMQKHKESKISSSSRVEKSEKSDTKQKKSTAKLLAEQRAYTIGLQTIPKIRGKLHSSYHYNLLLKTFFIHLTDVMVALSRFILTEPVLGKEDGTEEIISERIVKEESVDEEQEEMFKEEIKRKEQEETFKEEIKRKEEAVKYERHIEEQRVKEKEVTSEDVKESLASEAENEVTEKRKLCGSKMAQLTAKKSEELIQGMDAVITEFQNKAGIDEPTVIEKITQIENEVAKEGISSEMLSKNETKIAQEESSVSKHIMATETKMFKSEIEKKEERERRSKSREGKTIYVATVESHVYTNKDEILSEQFSDTSSVQSYDGSKTTGLEENVATVESSEAFEQQSKLKIEETKVKKCEASKMIRKYRPLQKVKIPEAKVAEIKAVKIAEPVVEQEDVTVEGKVILPAPKPFVELREDVEATVKVLQIISPPTEVIELEDNEYSKISTEESQTTSGDTTTKTFKSATVSEETSYHQDSQVRESAFTAKSAAIKTIQSNEESTQETFQQSIELSDEQASQQKLRESLRKLSLKTSDSFPSTISTPTPSTVPPTPLTDEYVFRIEAPMPKNRGPTPAPEDPKEPSPVEEEEHEDLNIVKKKLIPHIETKIERIVYDPPLPTPVEVTDVPVFAKRAEIGIINGDSKEKLSEEEILEIGRKSSLLASAIDETIKSIEEYKEQVGIETKKDVIKTEIKENNFAELSSMKTDQQSKLGDNISTQIKTVIQTESEPTPIYNGYVKEAKTIVYADAKSEISKETIKMEEDWSKVVDQFKTNSENNGKISEKIKTAMAAEEKSIQSNASTTETIVESAKTILAQESVQSTADSVSLLASSKSLDTEKKENKTEESLKTLDSMRSSTCASDNKVESSKVTFAQESVQSTTDSVSLLAASYSLQTKTDESLKTADSMKSSTYTSQDKVESISSVQEKNQAESVSTLFSTQKAKTDPMEGYRPVPFNPEEARRSASRDRLMTPKIESEIARPRSVTIEGETLGTTQGIVDGLEEVVMDEGVAKQLGKPGITEEKIAEIISGESEMLREAHVMGLSRVIASHMTRVDENDSSVDFKKIKPTIDSLKDSEVLKALNEDLVKTKDEKKKEERKWTTFLQKPKRPMPKAKFGYHGWLPQFDVEPKEKYQVKIVKQPKPKVAPDYKPEDFETGLLPWEERAVKEPPPPPVDPEDPILIPEEVPEFLVAVDPLPESEVPDLEETGIPLPPEKIEVEAPEAVPEETGEEEPATEEEIDFAIEKAVEETERIVEEMEQERLAEMLLNNVQNMVDPNATLEQQLAQMRGQLAALAQLPAVIQQSLELVTKQLMQLTQQEPAKSECQSESTMVKTVEEVTTQKTESVEAVTVETQETSTEQVLSQVHPQEPVKQQESVKSSLPPEELERMRKEEEEMIEEQRRIEKQNKVESTIEHYIHKLKNQQELMEQVQLEHESRQVKNHPTPRVGKPKPVFGPLTPQERPLILPGGRKWRKPKDAYNEAFIAETLTAQAEIIQGKAKGPQYESYLLPYDERVNFLKYEKPPISLDHLKESDTYKMVHNMDRSTPRRVELLTPVIAESDYREKCRSMTPSCVERGTLPEGHLDLPQQLQP